MKILGDVLNPNESVVLLSIDRPISTDLSIRLREAELRWHYSQHYYAEDFGEELLEEMITLAPTHKLKNLLEIQLRDEMNHARLYRDIADTLGLDDRAKQFGQDYSSLVKSQKTFCEKVFVFQMLTEAVAFGYVSWRLNAVTEARCNSADQIVFQDEGRHLKMAQPLLKATSPEELLVTLPAARRKALVREMIDISKRSMKADILSTIIPEIAGDISSRPVTTSLDRACARSVLLQGKEYDDLFTVLPGKVG